MEEKSKNKIVEYNVIRTLAAISVVIAHCAYYKITTNYGGNSFSIDTQTMSTLSRVIYEIIGYSSAFLSSFVMPLFFALSGAIFKISMDGKKYGNIKELIVKKGKRLLIPFFIITLLYTVPIKYLCNYYNTSTNIFKDIFVGQVLIQGNTHLWFLPILFLIFVISYIYIYIYTTKRITAFQ